TRVDPEPNPSATTAQAGSSTVPTTTAQGESSIVPADSCRTAKDCASGLVCQFTSPGCDANLGKCVRPDPPCTRVHSYCSCDGRTIYGCWRPFAPYRAQGECSDAQAPTPSDAGAKSR